MMALAYIASFAIGFVGAAIFFEICETALQKILTVVGCVVLVLLISKGLL